MNSNSGSIMGKELFVLILFIVIIVVLALFTDATTVAVFVGFVIVSFMGIAFNMIELTGAAFMGMIGYIGYKAAS